MKKLLPIVFIALFISCAATKNSKSKQVKTYYNGLIQGNYGMIKSVLADSLTTIAGDFVTPFTPDSYNQQFQWDSVFKPTYTIHKIEIQGDTVFATISNATSKFEFLKNNPLKLKHKFSFKAGKISKIEDFEYFGVNWDTWGKSLNTLVEWIAKNHPELNGFQFDLTKKGALNYLKAIELYKKSHQ